MKLNREIAPVGRVLQAFPVLNSGALQRLMGPMSDRILGVLPLKKLNCTKIDLPRADGTPMRVCVMRGSGTEGGTVGILWLHGGGYVLGAPEMAAITFPKQLLLHCRCVIVSPAYTLSCERPYPAALNDAYRALLWLKAHRRALGIDAEKLVVGGESAGGGLTAALCLYARDRGEDCIGLQMPLYPMLDDRATRTSENNGAPLWNTRANNAAWRTYLGGLYRAADTPACAAPARAEKLAALPPAISVVGTVDNGIEQDALNRHSARHSAAITVFFSICGTSPLF